MCFNDDYVVEEQRIDKGENHLLEEFCRKHKFDKGIIGSVADIPQEFEEMINRLPFPMMKMESGVTPVPIVNKYRTPKTLGVDRLAAAVAAAWLQPGRNVLIIDIGTCIMPRANTRAATSRQVPPSVSAPSTSTLRDCRSSTARDSRPLWATPL